MSRCQVVGVSGAGKRLPYRCRREAGHDGPCAMEPDAEVMRDETKVRPQHYKLSFVVGQGTVKALEEPVNECMQEVAFEVIDVIEALGYQDDAYLTTALVYLMRLRRKDDPVVDVKKAIWWLQRWIAYQETQP